MADDETGYTLDVRVVRISHVPCEGDRVAGRVVKVWTCRILTQASPLLVEGDLASAREHLQRFGGDLTAKSMNSRPNLLGRLWEWALGSDDEDAGPPPPEEPPFDR
ncbi:MAG: hypothetical protein K8T90_21740 [Planctomycetes bacterium]|nr:hypothetical protein [Planctomycetota bacterium]